MTNMLNFAELVVATVFAALLAASFNWLLLRVTFHLMQPAAVRKSVPTGLLVRASGQLARVVAPHP